MNRAALHTSWRLMRQRPHHLVDALNRLGAGVDIYSVGNFRGRGEPPHPPNSLRHVRLMPSQLRRVPGVARADRWRRRRLVRAFATNGASLHIFGAPPLVALGGKPPLLVYDCLDDWSSFPGAPPEIRRFEEEFCEAADRVWATSRRLEARLAARHGGKVSYVPNGVDYERFSGVRRKPLEGRRPVLGYIGAIDSWFDAPLLTAVARRLHDWEIVLVGPVGLSASQREVLTGENVRFLGRRPYEELPETLAAFDVAMIPFQLNELTRSTNPCKLYEYLAAGLGVVSTSLEEVCAFEEPGVVVCADEPESFARAVRDLAGADAAGRRRAVASRHGWRERFETALREIGAPGLFPRAG